MNALQVKYFRNNSQKNYSYHYANYIIKVVRNECKKSEQEQCPENSQTDFFYHIEEENETYGHYIHDEIFDKFFFFISCKITSTSYISKAIIR